MSGLQPLEALIYNGFDSIIGGNMAIMGLLVLAFFGGFVLLQGTRTDVKALILVPAFVLSMAFLTGDFIILTLVALALLLMFALNRLFGK
jgi:hypothetical protein